MKPNSYKEQKCCGTCVFVYEWWKYDFEDEYYCHQDTSKRPISDSDGDIDRIEHYDNESFLSVAWNRWAKPRKVEFHGVCDEWKERDK
jgi:hypothetical protein